MSNFIIFDPNDSEDISRKKIEHFYSEYSDLIRSKLLSKNIVRPQSVYDLLYPQTRENLLARNEQHNIGNLDKTSDEFRRLLLSKNKQENKDELSSLFKDIRNSLIARNNIIDSRESILDNSEIIRKNLLSKNDNISENDLLSRSANIRESLLSRNKSNQHDDLSISSKDIRNQNLSKNIQKDDGDLAEDSTSIRDLQKSKNGDSNNFEDRNLLSDSDKIRENQKTKNVSSNIDLDKLFGHVRESLISKNSTKEINLDIISESFREYLLSKNVDSGKDLEDIADIVRKSLLSKNGKEIDENKLLDLSEDVRRNLLSKNKVIQVSLDDLFEDTRKSILSKNKTLNDSDLDVLFTDIRSRLLSKNSKETGNTLDRDSIQIRETNISKNKSTGGDLLTDSEELRDKLTGKNKEEINIDAINDIARKNNLANNLIKTGDLLLSSDAIRQNMISSNVSVTTSLIDLFMSIRTDLLGRNQPTFSDLLSISDSYRKNLLASNKSTPFDIVKVSEVFRNNLLAFNVSSAFDLLISSDPFRKNLISKNKSNPFDLLSSSTDFRDDLLSKNIPDTGDLLTDSKDSRDFLIGKNIPSTGDLLADSEDPRNFLLGKNIPDNGDLLADSEISRDFLLGKNISSTGDLLIDSKNTRDFLIGKNNGILHDGDLLNDSQGPRVHNVSQNIAPTGFDLATFSQNYRIHNISSNIPVGGDLLAESKNIRDNLVARNGGGLFGINIAAAGTSTFLGVSRVLVQGILYRKILLSRNQYTKQSPYVDNNGNLQQNSFIQTLNNKSFSIDARSRAQFANTQSKFRGFTSNRFDDANGGFFTDSAYGSQTMLDLYGIGNLSRVISLTNKVDGSALYYGDNNDKENSIQLGSITDAIRRHNLERNVYSLYPDDIAPGGNSGAAILDSNGSPVADLIHKSAGKIGNSQPKSVTNPDLGLYVVDPKDSLEGAKDTNPNTINVKEGSNIVQTQVLGTQAFDDQDFRTGKKGVRAVVKAIKNSPLLEFAQNFDVQNNKIYSSRESGKDNTKFVSQRWTMANPYAPKGAEKLILYFKNYANNQSMFFPPYVSSFGHDSKASWNSVQFLGRPEPIFTYNNTTRGGNISFYVLTDFAQAVDMGFDYSQNSDPIQYIEEFAKNGAFTSGQGDHSEQKSQIDATLLQKNQQLNSIRSQKAAANGTETASLSKQEQDLITEIENLRTQKWELETSKNTPFAESSSNGVNIYNDLIANTKTEDGFKVGSAASIAETKSRIANMRKGLQFQPAFFSGDKVDFTNRIEFLEKMVRPSRNDKPGFSFIKPPVCHMHLGDWFNHDIIIDSITYDYSDVVWTSSGGDHRMQPMWAHVSISFNIVGIYRHVPGPALTADDVGGFFSDKIRKA